MITYTTTPYIAAATACSFEDLELAKVTDALAEEIFEQAKNSNSGDLLCVHIKPSFDNLGSVAQLRVVKKGNSEQLGPKINGSNAMDKETFKETLLAPAMTRGRAGHPLEPLTLKLNLGDELLSGIMALYVGIKRS